MNTPALSPISITSRPVRARLDEAKAEISAEFQRRLGRDATWNEVLERLLDAYAFTGPAAGGPAAMRAYLEGTRDDQDHS